MNNLSCKLTLSVFKTVYGMTETTAAAFFSLPHESDDNSFNSVGHLQNHMEAKVMDTQGRVVPMGEPGELYVRGYSTMLGYHNDLKATTDTIGSDKWLRTG